MTLVFGHRGAPKVAAENTVPAFHAALAQRADGVEFDVQLTKDGEIVVIHDETVDRTTDGSGWVKDFTFAGLRALDAGGAPIPTLREVLEVVAPSTLLLNVELKNSEVPYPGLEEKVLAMLDEFGLFARTVLSSFNLDSVAKLAAMPAPCELGALFEFPIWHPFQRSLAVGAQAIHPPIDLVWGSGYVKRAHEAGLAVRPWTVDSDRDLSHCLAWGVDAVFTNYPDRALAKRAEMAGAASW